jgi:glycosyltransferase involved in cell wall biosynthesis
VGEEAPAVSVGLAVRNEPRAVRRCIESVLAQDFGDFELVVSDNASDDETVATVEEYARADDRIRLEVHPANIGSHENMASVLERARGTFFRWISADDWIEPDYLSTCVRTLESRPDAIGTTTWFTIHTADAPPRYEEYRGEFPVSADPARRFERMLWFFHAGDAKYDPIYGTYRRAALERSHGLRRSERTDWLLCAELSLLGPILNVERRLAHRTRSYPVAVDRAAFRRRLDPAMGERLRTSPGSLRRGLYAVAVDADLSDDQLRRCRRALRRFWVREIIRAARTRLSDARHRALPSR